MQFSSEYIAFAQILGHASFSLLGTPGLPDLVKHATNGAPERGPFRACAASCHRLRILRCPHIADIMFVIAEAGDAAETPPASGTAKARSIKTPVQQQALEDAYQSAQPLADVSSRISAGCNAHSHLACMLVL